MEILDGKKAESSKSTIFAKFSLLYSIVFLFILASRFAMILGVSTTAPSPTAYEPSLISKVVFVGSPILAFIFSIFSLIRKEKWSFIKWLAILVAFSIVACFVGLLIFVIVIDLF